MGGSIAFDREVYIKRRNVLKKNFGKGKILLLGNVNSSMNFKDNHYPFKQDSTFLYYFGIDQPGLMAIIDVDKDREIIFGDELSIDDIIWTGPLPTLQSLAEQVGVQKVKSTSTIIKYVGDGIHFLPPYRPEHSILLSRLLGKKLHKVTKRASVKLIMAISQQREIKSEEEIVELNKAVTITNKMHLTVMESARIGMHEHELVGIAEKVARDHNVSLSFPPIMTTQGEVLHNHYYGNTLKPGDLLLFDGGCESISQYAGDITRTYPVDSVFSDRQRALYEIVYDAHQLAESVANPGTKFLDVHNAAAAKIVEGLIDIGLMKGDPEEAIINGAHTMFFQCGLGHMLGLDVHDMENFGEEYIGYTKDIIKRSDFGYKSLRLGKELKEGFVITIEPGIYIIPELIDMRREQRMYLDYINYDELDKWRNFGGIRLEDDFVITSNGAQLLGDDLPRMISEVENIRSKAYSQ